MYSLFEQGGGADCKVGVQNRIRERSERKFFLYPLFYQCRGTSKQISVYGPIEYIEICCLVVALINIGRPGLWYYESGKETDGGGRHLGFGKMSITTNWIELFAQNLVGRCITAIRR